MANQNDILATAGIDIESFGADVSALNSQINSVDSTAKKADTTFRNFGKGVKASANDAFRSLGNVSLQVQDIAVQFGSGASAARILAQQGSQLASIFGPAGMIAGGVVAIAATMWEISKGTDSAAKQAERFATAMQEVAASTKAAGKVWDTMGDKARLLGSTDKEKEQVNINADNLAAEVERQRLKARDKFQQAERDPDFMKKKGYERQAARDEARKAEDTADAALFAIEKDRIAELGEIDKQRRIKAYQDRKTLEDKIWREHIQKQKDAHEAWVKLMEAQQKERMDVFDATLKGQQDIADKAADAAKDEADARGYFRDQQEWESNQNAKKLDQDRADHQKKMDKTVSDAKKKLDDKFDALVKTRRMTPAERTEERQEKRRNDRAARSVNTRDRIRRENAARRTGIVQPGVTNNTATAEQAKAAFIAKNLQKAIQASTITAKEIVTSVIKYAP